MVDLSHNYLTTQKIIYINDELLIDFSNDTFESPFQGR